MTIRRIRTASSSVRTTFNYAVNGIPVAFWFDGVHEIITGRAIMPTRSTTRKMEKVTRTIFLTMWKLTDLKERPKIDKTASAGT